MTGDDRPLADPVQEGRRIVTLAADRGIEVRLFGGVAVAIRCQEAGGAAPHRSYKDVDLATSMKLQVYETNERDLQDAAALLLAGRVDLDRVAEVLAADWGWWRTATEVLDRVGTYAAGIADPAVADEVVRESSASGGGSTRSRRDCGGVPAPGSVTGPAGTSSPRSSVNRQAEPAESDIERQPGKQKEV